ncbi:hypothetical protein KDM41_10935 [bacterium]|nr:hypothetical protein [bacterium]
MPSRKTLNAATFLILAFAALLGATTGWAAPPERAPQVGKHMRAAHQAGEDLARGDLAAMEASLDAGYRELALMLESYHPDPQTNAYLRRRGWDQLVWTQLMYRLLAVRDGLCDDELVFAERVALDRVAATSLATVETTVARIDFLLEARTRMGLEAEIDSFAEGLLAESVSSPDYRELLASFHQRFDRRRAAVMARIASGEHEGIVDPAALPAGTRQAQVYQEHKRRLEGEGRLDEILTRLAEADPSEIQRLAVTARTADTAAGRDAARNELVLQLLLVETSLDASEHDASLADMFEYFDSWGHTAFESCGARPDDFQDAMSLIYTARRQLARHFGPDDLRSLYSLAETARGLVAEGARTD